MGNFYLLLVGILSFLLGGFAATFLFLIGHRTAQYSYEQAKEEAKTCSSSQQS